MVVSKRKASTQFLLAQEERHVRGIVLDFKQTGHNTVYHCSMSFPLQRRARLLCNYRVHVLHSSVRPPTRFAPETKRMARDVYDNEPIRGIC